MEEAKTEKTADFQEKFETDYSYSTLSNELKNRGYEQKWVKGNPKKKKEIRVKLKNEKERMNLAMTKECKERYESYLADKSYSYVHTTAAIMNYLDEIEKKELTVLMEV